MVINWPNFNAALSQEVGRSKGVGEKERERETQIEREREEGMASQ